MKLHARTELAASLSVEPLPRAAPTTAPVVPAIVPPTAAPRTASPPFEIDAGPPNVIELSKLSCWSEQTKKIEISISFVCFEERLTQLSIKNRSGSVLLMIIVLQGLPYQRKRSS